MNLMILGEHSDDKGKQLEKLTAKILDFLGYKNIKRNIIGSGGHEIDVVAMDERPGLGSRDWNEVICECKAYSRAMAMSDWLKFLGKFFIHRTDTNTSAYFIALNGVNGNVMGSYHNVKKSHRNIHLVTGEDLFRPLSSIYGISPVEEIQIRIKSLTDKNPTEISLCYYSESIYYILGFSDNSFSVLDQSGDRLEEKECEKICRLISNSTNNIHYLDLEVEKVAQLRKKQIKKYIVCILFVENDLLSLKDIKEKLFIHKLVVDEISELEIGNILVELEKEQLIIIVGPNYKLYFHHLELRSGEEILNLYKYLLYSETPLFIFESAQFNQYINQALLEEIFKVQGKISLSPDQKEDFLHLIKLSPSALHASLYPDEMITLHRQQFPGSDDLLNSHDVEYLFQKAHHLLFEDFKTPALHKYFLGYRGIVEIETRSSFIIKSNTKVELELDSNIRFRVGLMNVENTDQYILLNLLRDVKQPWEELVIKDSNEDDIKS